MVYVDGFVVPVPKKKVQAYRRLAQKAGKVWREHGALEFRECIADDVKVGKLTSFPRKGFFALNRKTIDYRDVREITLHKGFVQRTCGLGTIYLGTITTGTSSPNLNPFLAFGFASASASGVALLDIPHPDYAFEKTRQLVNPRSMTRTSSTL